MTFLLPRLARAVLAGIGTTYETLIPGPSIHGYRLDAAEVLAEAEAEQEVSEPREWFDVGSALRAAHTKRGWCASRNPNDLPHTATICDRGLGHDGDHRHGRSEFWPNETSAVTPPAAVDDPAGDAPASAPRIPAGSPSVPAGVSARPKNVAPFAGLDPSAAATGAIMLFNCFIEQHVDPSLHAHFADNDDNAAEYVRRAIRWAVSGAVPS